MNKKLDPKTLIKTIALLLILAVSILWVTTRSLAQTSDQPEDNWPIPGIMADQAAAELNPEEDNAGASSASVPDLIITDPGADVNAQIAELTGINAVESMIIPAAAFTADGNGRQWFFGFNSAYLYPNGESAYCGIAPLYLPNGVNVTSFIAYVLDNNAAGSANIYLYAKTIGTTTTSTEMASLATTTQNANIQTLVDATITQPTINNGNYTYHIGVCLGGTTSDIRFYAAQILYTR